MLFIEMLYDLTFDQRSVTATNEEKNTNEEKKHKWKKNYEEKPQMKKNHKRRNILLKKNHKWRKKNTNEENYKRRNILLKKNHKWRKTNVENFKEVTHEIEFMIFFRFRLVINYMWKIDRLWEGQIFISYRHKYVSHFLQITIII